MRKSIVNEVKPPQLDAVLEPTEWTTVRQWFTFFISKSSMKIDCYHIAITDWDIELNAEVVWRDRLIEFISSFDE